MLNNDIIVYASGLVGVVGGCVYWITACVVTQGSIPLPPPPQVFHALGVFSNDSIAYHLVSHDSFMYVYRQQMQVGCHELLHPLQIILHH